jgi:hypothetical protein
VRVVRRTVGGGGGQFINLSVGAPSDWVAPQLCFPRAAEASICMCSLPCFQRSRLRQRCVNGSMTRPGARKALGEPPERLPQRITGAEEQCLQGSRWTSGCDGRKWNRRGAWYAAVIRRDHGIAPDILIRGGAAPQWAG